MNKTEILEKRESLKKPLWQILLPRLLLGVIFTFSGLNGLFNLLPDSQYSTEGAAFLTAMKEGGFFTLLKIAELTAGILLIFNFAGQLGALILVPICIGIFWFHAVLSPQGSTLAWVAFALELVVLFYYRKNFLAMFKGSKDPAEMVHKDNKRKDKRELGDWVMHN